MIQKSQMETLILTKDKEFKQRVVTFMNNIAFHSEKIQVESLKEAAFKLNDNPKLLNLIIDGNSLGEQVNADFGQIKDLCHKSELMVLLYLSIEKMKHFKHQDHKLPNLFVYALPFEKSVFNEVFHYRGDQRNQGGASAPAKQASAASKKNVTAFETSGHVRDTIAMLNVIDKNREAIEQVVNVGQRFNGIMGAFSYFANNVGYKELRDMSVIVDAISRHYQAKEAGNKISDQHFNVLLGAAKSSFKLLQYLRESQAIPGEVLEEAQNYQQQFENLEDIKKRENYSQDDIDKLLETEAADE